MTYVILAIVWLSVATLLCLAACVAAGHADEAGS